MKKTSQQWCEQKDMELGKDILDPDGWDRSDFENSWNEMITEDEFNNRVSMSTIRVSPKMMGKLKD